MDLIPIVNGTARVFRGAVYNKASAHGSADARAHALGSREIVFPPGLSWHQPDDLEACGFDQMAAHYQGEVRIDDPCSMNLVAAKTLVAASGRGALAAWLPMEKRADIVKAIRERLAAPRPTPTDTEA